MLSRDDDAQKNLFPAMRGIAFRSASSGMSEATAALGLFVNGGSKGGVLDAALPLIDALCDVLVVVDSDTGLDDGALASFVAGLWADDRCAAACGYLLPSNPDESLLTRMRACEYSGVPSSVKVAQTRSGFVLVMAGALMAYRPSCAPARYRSPAFRCLDRAGPSGARPRTGAM